MFWCSVLYVIFELTGLLVAKCKTSPHDGICNKSIVYLVVILGSLICGTGASFIWVRFQLVRLLKEHMLLNLLLEIQKEDNCLGCFGAGSQDLKSLEQ